VQRRRVLSFKARPSMGSGRPFGFDDSFGFVDEVFGLF